MTYTPYQFANTKSTTVAGGAGGLGTTLNPTDTTLYVPTGHGADFPTSGFSMIRLGGSEYCKVTLNSADVFTIVRAQEGTTAGTWPVGTTVESIVSAQALNDGMTELATLDSGKANLSGAAFTGAVSSTGAITGQYFVGSQSATAVVIANNGTISTAGVGVSRVAPTGAVTGIIVQAGTVAGQMCVILNESGFTLTMAAFATSHVADGTSCVIAASSHKVFIWDTGNGLWYHS